MLALRLPLRLAARASPSNARLATPIVASSLAATRAYSTKTDDSTTTKKAATPKKAATTKKATPAKRTKKAAAPISKKAQKEAAAKAAYKLLTPEEKAEISANAKEAKKKEEIKLLKAQALAPPSYRQLNIWSVYVKEKSTAKTDIGRVSEYIKVLAQEFKNIDSREREHYNHLVNEHNAKSLREFQEWLNAHTPAQIKEANAARRRLRKQLADKKSQYAAIKDERSVKQPSSAYFQYHRERVASGDFRGVNTATASKDIAAEYKALSASEKKTYDDLSAKDVERYRKEHLEVYGYESPVSARAIKNSLAQAEAGIEPSA
ncbi:hypothetical protein E4T50_14017 [Aureobasidium sp. EXF-12298]|nr:hypothetical protein E4T50_14017 [Aureobasidium sp. EXF-12298]